MTTFDHAEALCEALGALADLALTTAYGPIVGIDANNKMIVAEVAADAPRKSSTLKAWAERMAHTDLSTNHTVSETRRQVDVYVSVCGIFAGYRLAVWTTYTGPEAAIVKDCTQHHALLDDLVQYERDHRGNGHG